MLDPKYLRREALRKLLLSGFVGKQSALMLELKRQGITATQPSISRDLRALGALKTEGGYLLREADYFTPLGDLRALLRDVNAAGPHLVLIRCEPGAASAIARALESENHTGLVGTVAGDDTVMAALEGKAAGKNLIQRIQDLLS